MHINPQTLLTVSRYLDRYAEPLIQDSNFEAVAAFNSVIVIPIFDEPEEHICRFLDFQKNLAQQQSVLMIWVFNAPENSKNKPSLERTQRVYKSLLSRFNALELTETTHLVKTNNLQILFVNRCFELLLPDKQGVGLARKLGMDLALFLTYQQYLNSQQWCYWIYSTDADVILPDDYALIPSKAHTTACIYPFKHIPECGFERAISEYEFSLHYYVESLKQAGSPYAFHTIGSLIVVSSVAYAQVRGIPKRAGAEDFYLLNKLAKLGRIESLSSPCLKVSGRPSHRVPFGTGPALMKINAQHENEQDFSVYHPRIFSLLKLVLESVSEIEHCSSEEDILLSRLTVKLTDRSESQVVSSILINLGWNKQAAHLAKLKTAEAKQQAFHIWFDAFVTLRFIHELRDNLYPNIVLTQLPMLLEEQQRAEAIRGTDFDYTAWFNALGI